MGSDKSVSSVITPIQARIEDVLFVTTDKAKHLTRSPGSFL